MTEETMEIIWHKACPSDSVTEDDGFGLKIGETRIGLYRLEDGGVHAIGDICTHEFAILSDGFVEGGAVECPLHFARFDIRTGKCHGPAAERDVPTYPTREEAGEIFVGIPIQTMEN